MNKQASQTSGGLWTGSSFPRLLRAVFGLACICGLAIFLIAFSIHAEFLEAKSGTAADSSKTKAGVTFLVSRKTYGGIIQNPAGDTRLRLASTIAADRPINANSSENVFHAGEKAAGLPPVPGASTGVLMVAGLAFLIWIQRLRKYWV